MPHSFCKEGVTGMKTHGVGIEGTRLVGEGFLWNHR